MTINIKVTIIDKTNAYKRNKLLANTIFRKHIWKNKQLKNVDHKIKIIKTIN